MKAFLNKRDFKQLDCGVIFTKFSVKVFKIIIIISKKGEKTEAKNCFLDFFQQVFLFDLENWKNLFEFTVFLSFFST